MLSAVNKKGASGASINDIHEGLHKRHPYRGEPRYLKIQSNLRRILVYEIFQNYCGPSYVESPEGGSDMKRKGWRLAYPQLSSVVFSQN